MRALFTPLALDGITLPNRLALPPMVCAVMPALEARADEEGCATPALLAHYRRRAQAGTGLIIVEATAVAADGRCWAGGLGAYDDAHAPGLAALAAAIRDAGAVAGIQLVHGGPQGNPALGGGRTLGPSAVAPKDGAPVPQAMTLEEIHAVQHAFAEAAARCADAGFQVIELHGAHGFLLDSFLMKSRNLRQDAYGGSREGRMRLLLETCRLVRERLDDRARLDCRISLFNKPEGAGGGRLEDLVRGLEATGLDLLHLSTDGAFKPWRHAEPEMGHAVGAYRDAVVPTLGQVVKSLTTLPVIVAGGITTPEEADRLIAEGHADLAAVGRAMLDDPDWATHARQALGG